MRETHTPLDYNTTGAAGGNGYGMMSPGVTVGSHRRYDSTVKKDSKRHIISAGGS
jgi:hypothetical protein